MINAYIKAISYHLPDIFIDNKGIADKFKDWSEKKILDKTGISKRYITAKDEFASDLAVKAANKLFSEHVINRENIDFIIYCTQSADYFLPTTACILQTKLGLSNNCGALDFNLGCSGYVYGLAICKGLISAGIAKNILFITSETYSKYIHPQDRGNISIFGDGASASLITNEIGFGEIGDFILGTDGSGFNNLIVKEGASRFKKNISGENNRDAYLNMDGPEVFSFTSKMIPDLVKDVLSKNNLEKCDIDLFIFHQANKFILDFLRKKIQIDSSKFFIHIENCGNTVSSTIPIALSEAIKLRRCEGKVLLAGFGVGYSWGGVVINYCK